MRIPENVQVEDIEYQEALGGLAELNYIASVGKQVGLSDAEVAELAFQAEYLNGLAMAGMDGFFKKSWKKIRKKTHKLRYKALKIIRKVAPLISMIPVIGIPFSIAYGAIEAQQAFQTKKKMKAALKKARRDFAAAASKEEKDLTEEELKASEHYAATMVKIAAAEGKWSKELEEEEKAAQVLLAKVREEFGPQASKLVETAEQGGTLTVPTSDGFIPIPPDPELSPDILPGVKASTGTSLGPLPSTAYSAISTSAASTKPDSSIGLIVGGGLAVGGLLLWMSKKKKRR